MPRIQPTRRGRRPPEKARAPEIHPWSGEELGAFLDWAQEQQRPDGAAWHLLAYTGMRRGEMLALRWRDIDLDQSRLSVRRSVGLVRTKGQGSRLMEGPTKSGRDRVVDLDPGTIDMLKRHRLVRAWRF